VIAYVTSDVEQHQIVRAAQYYGFSKPNRWINSGGLGNYGVWFASRNGGSGWPFPKRPVICILAKAVSRCVSREAFVYLVLTYVAGFKVVAVE